MIHIELDGLAEETLPFKLILFQLLVDRGEVVNTSLLLFSPLVFLPLETELF